LVRCQSQPRSPAPPPLLGGGRQVFGRRRDPQPGNSIEQGYYQVTTMTLLLPYLPFSPAPFFHPTFPRAGSAVLRIRWPPASSTKECEIAPHRLECFRTTGRSSKDSHCLQILAHCCAAARPALPMPRGPEVDGVITRPRNAKRQLHRL
jgi:hypothetical protein